ncbi:MAG TPA: hypothetical protein VGM90_26245 [Kofleriaceae bacterium]|jgi:hypothetical protein
MTDEDPLARVALHVWQPPPPRAVDAALLLNRMVTPAARPRPTKAIIAILATANVALVGALLFVLLRSEPPAPVPLAAGGPVVDSGTRDALHRLEEQQAQLARQLADVDQLEATIQSLSTRVQQCEQKTVVTPPGKPTPKPVAPSDIMLEPTIANTPPSGMPDSLDRAAIARTVTTIRPAINRCGAAFTESMPIRVKVRVKVTPLGRPSASVLEGSYDPSLGQCVVREMDKATFPRTKSGGTFSYPFTFGLELE